MLNRQGTQGQMDGASKSTLDNEFGVHNEEEVIKKILDNGTLQESEVSSIFLNSLHPKYLSTANDGALLQFPERQGPKNDAQQGSIAAGR